MISKLEQTLISALHRLTPNGQPVPHNPLQRVLSKTLRTLVPAPYKAPWMEWQYGTWMGTFAGYDEAGRQLGEANVLPEWLATPLRDEWRPFQGPGVRHGHPFNVDALREVTHGWDDLLLDAAALRQMHGRLHHREGVSLTAKDLYVIAAVAVSIPSFMLRRGDAPVRNGAVPLRAAAAFKVIGGMFVAASRMLDQAHPMLGQHDLNADVFLQYIEAERLLLSPELRACAAPLQMIRQVFSAVLDPASTPPAGEGLAHLGADAERAFAYGTLCARIDLGVLLHWRALRHYLQPLLHDPRTPAAARDALQQEPELGLENDTPLQAYDVAARHILSLFEPMAPEHDFLATLSILAKEAGQDSTAATIGANCYRLEAAMRTLVRQHQPTLDQLLQRRSPRLSKDAWSPAPGSSFLKHLFKVDARLTASL